MEDAPISTVPPCNDTFNGRLNTDWCHDCQHVLSVHRQDHVCSVCDAIAVLRAEILSARDST